MKMVKLILLGTRCGTDTEYLAGRMKTYSRVSKVTTLMMTTPGMTMVLMALQARGTTNGLRPIRLPRSIHLCWI